MNLSSRHTILNCISSFLVVIYSITECVCVNSFNQEYGPIFPLQDGRNFYSQFLKDHPRKFESQLDYENRYQNFVNTLRKINDINSKRGSMKVKPSETADMSDFERMQKAMQKANTPPPDSDIVNYGARPNTFNIDSYFNLN